MPSALLWAYSAENLFYNCNSGKSADFPELLFHRWGRRGKQHLQRRFLRKRGAVEGLPVCFQHAEPSQAHIRSPAPPKGELFAVTAQFPDKMQALRMRQKLPLSGELANPKDLTERVSPPILNHPTKRELPCKMHSSSRYDLYKITGSDGWGRGTGTRHP